MSNILKPKIGRLSKSPIDKSVSGDKDLGNINARELHNSMHAADKSKQMDVGKIKGKPPPYSAIHSETEKDDGHYEHRLNGTGTREHGNKISSRKEQKTKPERITMAEHGGPSTDAVVPVDSGGDGESTELESVYEEEESVFDDKLVFEDGFLGYETSSVSLSVCTDRAMSEELTTDDSPEEDSSYCHVDSSTEENEKPSPASEATRASEGTQILHPDELEATDTGYAAVDKNLHQSRMSRPKQSSPGSSQRAPQSRTVSRCDVKDDADHVGDSSGEPNLCSKQPHDLEDVNTSCMLADESLERHQLSGKSSSVSSQKPSWTEPGNGSSCDDSDWHLDLLFQTSSDAATPVNDNTAAKSHIPPASSSDQRVGSDLFQESASTDAIGEQNSDSKIRSLKSGSLRDIYHPRLGDSAAGGGEEARSNVMPNFLHHLDSRDSSSDWHLSSLFYDELTHDNQVMGRGSRGRYSSSTQSRKSSVDSSEWHIGSLLFESSDLSGCQLLSGDLCVHGHSQPAECILLPGSFLHSLCYLLAANAFLYDRRFNAPDVLMNKIC